MFLIYPVHLKVIQGVHLIRCYHMKILHMECGGLVIYHLKLERGYIHLPTMTEWEGKTEIQTDWTDLVMMVEGIYPDTCKRAKRWSPKR